MDPFTQYTEPGYRAPQYSAAAPAGTQSYGPNGQPIAAPSGNQATFLFGNNGSAGSLSGTLSNTTPGQSSMFYQNQPSAMSQSNPSLGQFTQYNPSLQALNQSRSQ